MQQHKQLVVILETAIIAAFAMALTYIPHTTGVSAIELNYGLIPIAVLAMRRGLVPAAWAGFVWGILDLILLVLLSAHLLNTLSISSLALFSGVRMRLKERMSGYTR